jgi:hypothetical protein
MSRSRRTLSPAAKRELGRIPPTSLHTEVLFESLDSGNAKQIRDLVVHDNADLNAHDWMHNGGRTPMHRAVENGVVRGPLHAHLRSAVRPSWHLRDTPVPRLTVASTQGCSDHLVVCTHNCLRHATCRSFHNASCSLKIAGWVGGVDGGGGGRRPFVADLRCVGVCGGWGVVWGQVEMMSLLVELGGSVNVPDGKGRSPVHYAARIGNEDILAVLLGTPGVDLALGSHVSGALSRLCCCPTLPVAVMVVMATTAVAATATVVMVTTDMVLNAWRFSCVANL